MENSLESENMEIVHKNDDKVNTLPINKINPSYEANMQVTGAIKDNSQEERTNGI